MIEYYRSLALPVYVYISRMLHGINETSGLGELFSLLCRGVATEQSL